MIALLFLDGQPCSCPSASLWSNDREMLPCPQSLQPKMAGQVKGVWVTLLLSLLQTGQVGHPDLKDAAWIHNESLLQGVGASSISVPSMTTKPSSNISLQSWYLFTQV